MLVHTYYQPVAGIAPPDRLLALWRESWEKQGWETKVLNEDDAKAHPGYSYFLDKIKRFPTSNPSEYERACYLRHLAMANIGSGVLADYDVINRAFKPDDLEFCFHQYNTVLEWPVFLEPTLVPCAIYGDTATAWENYCDAICEFDTKGQKHVSDMTITRDLATGRCAVAFCIEHLCSGEPIRDNLGAGWKTAKMIHFSNFSFSKLGWQGEKSDLIRRALEQLPS